MTYTSKCGQRIHNARDNVCTAPTSTSGMQTHLVIKEVLYNRVSRRWDLMSSTKDPLLEQDAAVRSSSF